MQKAFMPDENEQSLMLCHLARGLLRAVILRGLLKVFYPYSQR